MKKWVMGRLILLISVLFLSSQSGHAFELNGFADVSFTKSTEGADEFRNGDFAFGTLDLYLAQTMDDIDFLVELVVEEGDVLDLERLTLGYTFSDALKLRVGRFHTPLGFWNTSYHHGVQLQPTIDRPHFLRFEDDDGILPVHVIGAYISGRTSTAVGGIEYGVMLGNGPRITAAEEAGDPNVLHPNNISDNNNSKAIAFNAAISPSAIEGLKIGLSGHIAEIESDATVTSGIVNDLDQTIFGAALTYSIGNIHLASEYFSIQDTDNSGATDEDFTSNAYYGLITYTLLDKYVPYLMYENISVKEDDPYFISLGTVDTQEMIVGLRYNINYRSAVKGEYRKIIDISDLDWNEYAIQWTLAF